MRVLTRLTCFVFLICLSLGQSAAAQEAGRTILVFDASNSMWGQIDGKAKITIAQEVIIDLLKNFPADQKLGLTVYGHREKSDCKDIETIVQPDYNTAEIIADAVRRIKPKGRTPLSAAVIAAAEALQYTTEKATVILVTDGRETCNFDPCEVGKKLEAAGVDFTAHVVGFDIAKAEVKAQLQCLAENTGGTYLNASNASELTKALLEVAEPAQIPDPVPALDIKTRIIAVDSEGGKIILTGLLWQLHNDDLDQIVVERKPADRLSLRLKPGTYTVDVIRVVDEAGASLTLNIAAGGKTSFRLVLPPYAPAATLDAPDQALAGSQVLVAWTGPNQPRDFLSTASADDRPRRTITSSYVESGTPVSVQMPPNPGLFELRYVHSDSGKILASKQIEVQPVSVTIDLPKMVTAGETLVLNWTGPNYELDYLATAIPGDRGTQTQTYSYTRGGNPTALVMPVTPGEYEVRYVLHQGDTVVFSELIMVTDVAVSLDFPTSAVAGETVMINWTGPNYRLDYLSVSKIGARGTQTINYAYTKVGGLLGLEMPTTPGTYEIRYVLNQGNTVIAAKPIKITNVTVKMSSPDTAVAGSSIMVDWRGPDYRLDYLSVVEKGARGSKAINYSYTKGGNPLELVMPVKPGSYEIRYVLNQGDQVIATNIIKVSEVTAKLQTPDSAKAGTKIVISWQGPDYHLDFVSIAEIGSRGSKNVGYAYTRNGSQLQLAMPKSPGDYEIRYVLHQGNTVIARQKITVK